MTFHGCVHRVQHSQERTRSRTEMPVPRQTLTILGLGSLLSERSARVTFPELTGWRLVRVHGYRRVFAHTPSIFMQRGIADAVTLQMASLGAEPCAGASFVATAFDVPDDGTGMEAFREREEEYDLRMVPFESLDDDHQLADSDREAMLCVCSSDEDYIKRWGIGRFQSMYTAHGLRTCWDWPTDSGLRPCATYLRHCALAAEKLGPIAYRSFLDETYLCDRRTTIRDYLAQHPEVMSTPPPADLAERYGG